MSSQGNSQHKKMFKSTQKERNSSSTFTDSSSDEELTPRHKKLLPNLDIPGSSGKAAGSGILKRTAKKRFRAREKKSARTSVEMNDLKEFSRSLIKDLKAEGKKMLAKFKKDLRNVAAENSTQNTTNNGGRHVLDTSQALGQITPHSEPQQGQHMISSSTRIFTPPAGLQIQSSVHASNTGVNPAGRESLWINAVNQPAGYFSNLLQQSSYPNASVMGYGIPSPLHQNNIHTSGPSVMTPGVGFTLNQRLGNTFHIPNQTMAGYSSGGVDTSNWNMNRGPIMFPAGTSHLVPNSVATNHFRSNMNQLGAFEAWQRMYGSHNGNFQ